MTKRKGHSVVRGRGGGSGRVDFLTPKRNARLRPLAKRDVSDGCLVLLIVVCLFWVVACNAQGKQKYKWQRAIAPASLSFAAGAAWGTNQILVNKNENFFRVFPNANRRFWGADSWKNKYNNFNPENGRNGTPIWFTDGKHLTASFTQVCLFGAGVTIGIGEKRPFWHYVADVGISFAAYSVGNYLTYNQLFK